MKTRNDVLSLINRQKVYKITNLATNSDGGFDGEDRHEVESAVDANVVSSERIGFGGQYHAVLLDLDVPAFLVPSSTPGHSHLYIDVTIGQEQYFSLLKALADAGVIEPGYAGASIEKGATFLRLPWVKKGQESGTAPSAEPF